MADLAPDLSAALKQQTFQEYCALSAFVLLFYDQLLTIPEEIKHIWTRKISAVTAIFALIRYVTLLSQALQLVVLFPSSRWTDKRCAAPIYLGEASEIILLLVFALFSSLRVYAIWGRDWRPASVVLAISLSVPVLYLAFYAHTSATALMFPFFSCGQVLDLDVQEYVRLRIAISTCAIAADGLVVILTWTKTFGIKRMASRLNIDAAFTTLLLRDGTVYFVTILVLHLLDLITGQTALAFNAVPQFIDVIQAILICRFLFSLRVVHLADREEEATSVVLSTFSAPRFASSVVGNLGAPLHHGREIHSEDDILSSQWEHEGLDEILQISNDPLAAGLFNEEQVVNVSEHV